MTEVAGLAPICLWYKSNFLKRLAEQEGFSYTEVMYYANIF